MKSVQLKWHTFLIETFIDLQGVYALYEKAYERVDYI